MQYYMQKEKRILHLAAKISDKISEEFVARFVTGYCAAPRIRLCVLIGKMRYCALSSCEKLNETSLSSTSESPYSQGKAVDSSRLISFHLANHTSYVCGHYSRYCTYIALLGYATRHLKCTNNNKWLLLSWIIYWIRRMGRQNRQSKRRPTDGKQTSFVLATNEPQLAYSAFIYRTSKRCRIT